MSDREIVVVDIETTGLNPKRHSVVEVAWWNLATDERGEFVPWHKPSRVLAKADIVALRVNGYLDRLADAKQDDYDTGLKALLTQLKGNTFAGCNPAFDAAFLTRLFRAHLEKPNRPNWHHRMLDVSAYAAGVLHLPPTELPGLATVCELLEVVNTAPHTAEGDVDATGRCIKILMEMAPKP